MKRPAEAETGGKSMNKYMGTEILTARNLIAEGYKWLARDEDDTLFAFREKPYKDETVWIDDNRSYSPVCSSEVPLFQDIKWDDKEPVSLESIIHPPILDDAEMRYLEHVLRPLPKIKCITKIPIVTCLGMMEYLFVKIVRIGDNKEKVNDSMRFPYFQAGTMYKGMIGSRDYTPEELGLNLEGKHVADRCERGAKRSCKPKICQRTQRCD